MVEKKVKRFELCRWSMHNTSDLNYNGLKDLGDVSDKCLEAFESGDWKAVLETLKIPIGKAVVIAEADMDVDAIICNEYDIKDTINLLWSWVEDNDPDDYSIISPELYYVIWKDSNGLVMTRDAMADFEIDDLDEDFFL